jgi:hypothetical protein
MTTTSRGRRHHSSQYHRTDRRRPQIAANLCVLIRRMSMETRSGERCARLPDIARMLPG